MNWDTIGVILLMVSYLAVAVWVWRIDHAAIVPYGRQLALRVIGALLTLWLLGFWIPRLLWSLEWFSAVNWPIRNFSSAMHAITIFGYAFLVWTIRESAHADLLRKQADEAATAALLNGNDDEI